MASTSPLSLAAVSAAFFCSVRTASSSCSRWCSESRVACGKAVDAGARRSPIASIAAGAREPLAQDESVGRSEALMAASPSPGSGRKQLLAAVIGMPGQDADGAVDLLQQHHANQLMRPGRRAKRKLQAGLVAQRGREPIVAADDEDRGRPAVVAPAAEPAGERRAVEAFAALVEDDGDGPVGDDAGQ